MAGLTHTPAAPTRDCLIGVTEAAPIPPGATRRRQTPSVAVTVLGVVTIAAYGVACYSYGVLIDPIRSTTTLTAIAFCAAAAIMTARPSRSPGDT